MASVPKCGGGMSRRHFCVGAGVGLVTLGLPGCDPAGARIGVGGLDQIGKGSDPGSASDMAEAVGDLAGRDFAGDFATQPHDAAVAPGDMARKGDMAQTGGSCATGVNGGLASAVTTTTALLLSGSVGKFFLCRDAGGLYAMSAACTHSGVTIKRQTTQFWCPSHGATFDLNGQHPTSPAFSPLDHYAVCIDSSGHAIIDVSSVVAATKRV